MKTFHEFKQVLDEQMVNMSELNLFKVRLDKDELYETYLASFEPGTNPIHKTNTEHDCQCCKHFIRDAGGMVAIIGNQLVSIWDVEVGEPYQVVADAMAELVKSRSIMDVFLHRQTDLGTDYNHQSYEGRVHKWEHFHFSLPNKFVKAGEGLAAKLGWARANKEVLQRSLEELTIEAGQAVEEMIAQGSLYRGQEHLRTVQTFLSLKGQYDSLSDQHKDNFCWENSCTLKESGRIRNTVIGTLLSDLSAEVDLDQAVASFEAKVAPTNYKRPKAIATKGMIEKAQKTAEELGLMPALGRRYAVVEDISINDVLFADRDTKPVMSTGDVFDDLAADLPVSAGSLSKIEEVPRGVFLTEILPKADRLEMLFDNKHVPNLVNVIAPINRDSTPLFKWDNNFSWAYNGEVADSIKERVKRAGGSVTGVLRCSLAWFNTDDLDIHVKEPNGMHIYYSNKYSDTGGNLDVDMNARGPRSTSPVENVTWPMELTMKEGTYEVWVHNYNKRQTVNGGFDAEIEHGGTIHRFSYGVDVRNNEKVMVAIFKYSHAGGIEFISSLPKSDASKVEWGLDTQKFHKVDLIMRSPNYWNRQTVGNEHLFFILEGCKKAGTARGFFNEFLREDLREHRKVFELLGSKLKAEASDNQIAGLGFSSTLRNSIVCKVSGSFSRIIKVNL